jgi:hypothetical protein
MLKYFRAAKWNTFAVGAIVMFALCELPRLLSEYVFQMPGKGAFVVFDGAMEIPEKYWLDMSSYDAGISYVDFSKTGGRIAVGRKSELKPDFWTWLQRDKIDEKTRCGVIATEAKSGEIKSTLLHNEKHFVMFVGVPDVEVERAINSLCRFRMRFEKHTNLSNSPLHSDAQVRK